jgi:hypothetical protein
MFLLMDAFKFFFIAPNSSRNVLEQGANIEAQSKRGYTALILGSSGGNKTIVELLLRCTRFTVTSL